MHTVTAKPEGSVGKAINFHYYNPFSATSAMGTQPFQINTDTDVLTMDFKEYEKLISDSLKEVNPTLAIAYPSFDVTIFAFEVILAAIVEGTINGENVVFTQPIEQSTTYFVGGRLLERDEVLREFNGDLQKIKTLPQGYKGVKNCVPNLVFPFKEGKNVLIPREKLVLV